MDLRGDIVFCDASQGPYTATLPPASTVGSGYVVAYKKTDGSANAVTIVPAGAETIDGQAAVQLTFPYQSVQVATNGANWFLLPVLPFAGGVVGPKTSTDNAVALWDGTDGTAIKNSPWILDPATGAMTIGGSAPGLASTGGGDIAIAPDGGAGGGSSVGSRTGGGGGGAGGNGTNAAPNTAGNGGSGVQWAVNSQYYGGGGGGGGDSGTTTGAGGLGGGGNGSSSSNGAAGTTGTGGGGGGGRNAPSTGGNGGSGVVIVAYLGTTTKATGGTISNDGTYTYHTFTAASAFTWTG